jgi:hypothetical protein
MPKATIREDDQTLSEVIRDEWSQLAEEVGSEIQQIFLSGSRPESLTVEFAGMTMAEWEALPEETRRDLQEYGADG